MAERVSKARRVVGKHKELTLALLVLGLVALDGCGELVPRDAASLLIPRLQRSEIYGFVAGLGTTGTFVGTVRRLRELSPSLQAISVQPDSPFHGLEGLKHMATAIVPAIYDPRLANRNFEVETEAAYAMVRRLAREEGIMVGISAAAAVVASERIARTEAAEGRRATIVTVLPDSADKYLSERFWEEY